MQKIFFFISIIFIFSVLSFSCGHKKRFEIDSAELKKTENQFHIIRFDSAIINLDTNNAVGCLKNLATQYPEIYAHYFDMLEIDAHDTTFSAEMILNLLTDTTYSKVNAAVARTFANVAPIERKMASVYTYFKTFFPDIKMPELFFFVSGCNISILTFPGYIGIGTDWYLGADFFDFYNKLSYEYLVQNMQPESIPIDFTLALLKGSIPFRSESNRLIDNILYQGKLLYFISVMLPDETPENIAGYTSKQLGWCEKYKREIWAAIIDQKHLFSSDYKLIRDYTGDAPFTMPISQDSPGRVGNWIGWQIVKSYMENNADVSLQMLALDNDFQKILEKSKFKP
ncbi:MAG: hypothetical protein FWF72_00695 [Paludibacter sp.]|nr:hypothetical protein [Paludibacter sp.]